MSVHKYKTPRGLNRWRVMWRDSSGRQHSRSFSSYAEARDADAGVRLGVAPEPYAPPTIAAGQTLAEWILEWFELYSREWADGTFVNRKSIFEKWIEPLIGREPIATLTRKRVRSFREAVVSKGGSTYTANKCVRELSACLGAAVDNDLIDHNPCSGIKRLTEAPTSARALTGLEVEKLRALMPTARDRLVVVLMAYAGLRPAEVCGLQWKHVGTDLILIEQSVQGGRVKATKTGKSRSIPITDPVKRELRIHGRGEPDDFVVHGERGGIMPWAFWVTDVWKPVGAKAGITARAYDLRHSYASLMLAGGASVIDTSRAMGHSKSSVTLDVYSHSYAQGQLPTRVPLDAAIRAARIETRRSLREERAREARAA